MIVAFHIARGTNLPSGPAGFTLLQQSTFAPYSSMWARVVETGDGNEVSATVASGTSQALIVQEFEGAFEPISAGVTHAIGSGTGTSGTSPSLDTSGLGNNTVVVGGFTLHGAQSSFSGIWSDSFNHIDSGSNGSAIAGASAVSGYRTITTTGIYSTSTTWTDNKTYTSFIGAFSSPLVTGPSVSAGADQTVQIDSGTVTLTATGNPSGGTYSWAQTASVLV